MNPEPSTTMIAFDRLNAVVRGAAILEDITWRIEKGVHWAVVGPNGAGKTSLLKIILGHQYYRGNFFIADGLRDKLAYVSFDRHALLMRREAGKTVARDFSNNPSHAAVTAEALIFAQTGEAEALRRHRLLADLFPIEHLLRRDIRHLSTGELRKVIVAQALASSPELLLLDEPYSGLDAGARRSLRKAIERLTRAGIQLIMVTHRFEEIPEDVDRILCLRAGRIFAQGKRDDIFVPEVIDRLYRRPSAAAMKPAGRTSDRDGAGGADIPFVRMRNVTVAYGAKVVLDQVNWTVTAGQNWMVCGPNGSGKTTLLSLITADHPQAYANAITLFGRRRGTGESIWDIKQKIGMVSSEFQIRYAMPSFPVTAYQVVLSGFFDSIGLFRQASHEQRRIADDWLDRLALTDYRERVYERLSFGEQRMVLIARAMVKSPLMLILDEPFQGVDYANRAILLQLVDHIGMTTGTTVIYVTHGDERLRCITHRLDYDPGRSRFYESTLPARGTGQAPRPDAITE